MKFPGGKSIRATFVLFPSIVILVFFSLGALLLLSGIGAKSATVSRANAYSIFSAWADRLEIRTREVQSGVRLLAGTTSLFIKNQAADSVDSTAAALEDLLLSYAGTLDFTVGAGLYLDFSAAKRRFSLHAITRSDKSIYLDRFDGIESWERKDTPWVSETMDSAGADGKPMAFLNQENSGNRQIITYAFPIRANGKNLGVATVEIDLQSLYGFLNSISYTKETDTLLAFRETGEILYSKLGSVGENAKALSGIIAETKKSGAVFTDAPLHGENHLVFSRSIADDYILIMTVPFSQAFQQVYRTGIVYLALSMLFFLAIISVVSLLAQNHVVRRIRVLSLSLDSIAAGNFDDIRPLEGRDELADLSGKLLGVVREIQKREYTIGKLDGYLGTVLDALPEALVVVSPLGQIHLANKPFVEGFAGGAKVSAGGNLYECVPSMTGYKAIIKSVADSQSGLDFYKEQLPSSAGSLFRVRFLPLASGNETSCLIVFMDMSDMVRTEELERQKRMFESMAGMAGGLAHDFGNIINSVLGSSDMLLFDLKTGKRPDDEDLLEIMKTIELGARRGADLIKRLHLLSRPKSKERLPVPLRDALRSAGDIARASLDANVILNFDESTDTGTIVYGDRVELEQAFVNMIGNAGHAVTVMRPQAEPKGGTITVRISEYIADIYDRAADAKPGARYACIEIEDTGVGMDEATLAKVFDPFFTTKPYGVGTGLGMSVCYSAVKRHGGFMRISSRKGSGTCVRVYLPLETPEST